MKKSKTNTSFLYLAFLTILISSAMALFLRSNAFNIEHITIKGVTYIPPQEIEQLAGGFKGENLFLYDQGSLREKIKLHPFVEEMEFKRDLPHTLVIEVTERTPYAHVIVGNGIIEVDQQGTFLRRFESWPSEDKPVISGVNIPETAGPGQVLKLPQLTASLNVLKQAPNSLLPIVGEVHVNPVNQVTIMLTTGIEVRLGHAEVWTDKLAALKQLIEDQGYKAIEEEVRYIDFTAAKPVIGRF